MIFFLQWLFHCC